jgi:hypothetical protein
MFNFAGITHVITNPKGTYSLVGSVPLAMMEKRKPTTADIMGGRVQPDGFAYVGKAYATIQDIRDAAEDCGAHLCDSPTCGCFELLVTVHEE